MPVFPLHTGTGIGYSFQSALHMAATESMEFGPEVVFTYGPLGFVAFPQLYTEVSTWIALFSTLTLVAGIACASILIWRRVLPQLPTLVCSYLTVVVVWNRLLEIDWATEAASALTVVVAVSLITKKLRREDIPIPIEAIAVVFGVLTALFTLIKLSAGIQILGVAATSLWVLASDSWRPSKKLIKVLGIAAFSAAVSLVAIWTALGQPLANLKSFVGYSWLIASEYAAAMGIEPSDNGWQYSAALMSLVLLAFTISKAWRGLPGYFLALLPIGWYVFTMFKHGFVRHDRHSLVFFIGIGLLALAFVDRETVFPALAAAIVCLVSAWGAVGVDLVGSLNPGPSLRQSVQVATLIARPAQLTEAVERHRSSSRDLYQLSKSTTETLNGRTVHIDPWETKLLWTYPEFEWAPAPVFQSYSAYAADLDRLNANTLSSNTAPEYILRSADAIDGRDPASESPSYMITMLCRYRAIGIDSKYTILKLGPSRCGDIRLLRSIEIRFGESANIPKQNACDGYLVYSVEGLRTFGQRVQSLLFKDAVYSLIFAPDRSIRLVPGTARHWHLIPREDSPDWLGSVIGHEERVTPVRSGPDLLAPTTVRIDFGCLAYEAAR